MGYKINVFETAAEEKGYYIDRIKSNQMGNVTSMLGSPKKNKPAANLRWNDEGHCYTRAGLRVSQYDLPLSLIADRINNTKDKKQGVFLVTINKTTTQIIFLNKKTVMNTKGVIPITEKEIITDEDQVNLFLNSICLNMGKVGILMVDRDHPKLRYYLESALQVAIFFGDTDEQKRLQKSLILEN